MRRRSFPEYDFEPDEVGFTPDPTTDTALSLIALRGNVRVCSVSSSDVDRAWEVPRRLDNGGLADPGANICMTNHHNLLVNLRHLHTPIPAGVAVTMGGNDMTESLCTHTYR